MKFSANIVKNKVSTAVFNRGMEYFLSGKVKIKGIKEGAYSAQKGSGSNGLEQMQDIALVSASVGGNQNGTYEVEVVLSREGLEKGKCDCLAAFSNSYCKHMAAVVFAYLDETKNNPTTPTTDYPVMDLISTYAQRQVTGALGKEKPELIDLELKIMLGASKMQYVANLKVGNIKKYVVKDVYDFLERVNKRDYYCYGKNLAFVHNLDNFTLDGRKIIEILLEASQEQKSLSESGGYTNTKALVGDRKEIPLTPTAFDQLFDIYENKEILIKHQSKQKKLFFKKENKQIELEITRDKNQMIQIKIQKYAYYMGGKTCYIIADGNFYQCDEDYKKSMDSFLEIMDSDVVLDSDKEAVFQITKGDLSSLSANVFTQIYKYINITHINIAPEEYEPPIPQFDFYLDLYNRDTVTCEVRVTYGEVIYNIIDPWQQGQYRDLGKERAVGKLLAGILTYSNKEKKCFHNGGNQDELYQFLVAGVGYIMELGQVHATSAFERLKFKASPTIAMNITMDNHILDIKLKADDFSFGEIADLLNSYRLRKKYHRLTNGDFIQLEDNSISAILEVADGMHLDEKHMKEESIQLPVYRSLYLDSVLRSSQGITFNRDTHFKELVRSFRSVEDSDYPLPQSLTKVLRGYQKTGYRWLKTLDQYGFGGILADDMGLGKTLQIIALILSTKEEGNGGTALIVCPASLIYNWENEISRFAPELTVGMIAGSKEDREKAVSSVKDYDVMITSYDLLKRDYELYTDVMFRYQIIDEAQYIKNHTTIGAKAAKSIKARTKFALTGTPIENRLSELWSIFDYLMPGLLYSYNRFKQEFELPIIKDQDPMIIERMKKIAHPFILRRLKKDVLKELPGKLEQVIYTRLEGEQNKLYQAYQMKVKDSLSMKSDSDFNISKIQILAELTRLRQICCDPSLCYENYYGDSAKLESCLELINNAIEGGHKLLLFSQFTSMLDIIGNKLREQNITYYSIVGSTPKDKRMEYVNQFNEDDVKVFLISLKAGGTGLNLTGADIVIHYDPWWNIAAQNQATDRAHRIGQKNRVTVFKLIAKDTIEEKILALQESKKELADQILSGDSVSLSALSKVDLLDILSDTDGKR